MKSISDLLADHPFFRDLTTAQLATIAGCGVNIHARTDQSILRAGQPANHFYVIRSGKVAIEIDSPQKGSITIDTISAEDILGVSWLLPPFLWEFNARALEPISAISIDAECLRQKCDEDPSLGYEMFKRFAGLIRNRLVSTRMQVLDVYGSHVSE